jgi:hypothetical protein
MAVTVLDELLEQEQIIPDFTGFSRTIHSQWKLNQQKTSTILPSRPRWQSLHQEEEAATNTNSELLAGHARAEMLLWYLDHMGYKRSNAQKELHWKYFVAALAQIYGVDLFQRNEVEILERWNVTSVQYEVFCVAPRRFGKTFSVAMFLAAMLVVCISLLLPFVESVFSPGARQSAALKRGTLQMLKCLPGFAETFNIKNKGGEEVCIHPHDNKDDLRYAYFYPSSKTLKGTGAKAKLSRAPLTCTFLLGGGFIVLEEVALLDMGVFFEVVVPLMGMIGVCMVGISTPKGTQNFFHDLITMRDARGNLLFNVFRMELICDACKAMDSAAKRTECVHRMHLLPPWKTLERQERIKMIMKDRPNLYLQGETKRTPHCHMFFVSQRRPPSRSTRRMPCSRRSSSTICPIPQRTTPRPTSTPSTGSSPLTRQVVAARGWPWSPASSGPTLSWW